MLPPRSVHSRPVLRRSRRGVRWIIGLLAIAALGAACAASGAPALTPDAAAHCVAVIERRSEVLAERVRQGDDVARAALRAEIEHATVLIGEQYLAGSRDEDVARARLERARQEQRAWPEERRAALYRQCNRTAATTLSGANKLERLIVRRLAAKRLDRMLARQARAAASAPAASSRASEPKRP